MPLLIPLTASLGLGTAGALSRQQAQQWLYDSYKNLGYQITQGLFALEGSIAIFEDWVGSLTEAVLQYYRALGLLCVEQRGYCMSLGKLAASMKTTQGLPLIIWPKIPHRKGKALQGGNKCLPFSFLVLQA